MTKNFQLKFLFSLFCASLFLGCYSQVDAAKIYRYIDDNGNLSFSDKPVGDGQLVQVEQVEVYETEKRLFVQRQGSKDNFTLLAINDYFAPVEVEFTIQESHNILTNYRLPTRFLINSRSQRETISIWRKNPRVGYSYTYSHSFVYGDPSARHLPLRPYLMPVSTNDVDSFRISQAFNGARTHTHPQSQYAVDIPVPEGTNIYAARSGVVMDVANDFFRNGRSEKDKERANYVRILHDDGTMALYAHLKLESVQFAMGLRVERGQIIGKSGNTGYSGGPHLHFAIQKNYGMELRSLPFEFEGPDGRPFKPREGMVFQKHTTPVSTLKQTLQSFKQRLYKKER